MLQYQILIPNPNLNNKRKDYWIQPVCPGGCCFTLASYSNQTIAKVVKYLLLVLAQLYTC